MSLPLQVTALAIWLEESVSRPLSLDTLLPDIQVQFHREIALYLIGHEPAPYIIS
jgi:hypothetical protein